MKTRLLITVIIVVVALVGVGLTVSAWMMRPKLLEIYPHPGAVNVSATTPIRLIFSQPMQSESVTQHLSIEPSTSGNFSWDGNTLTFIPGGSWPTGQEIRLKFSAGSKAASWLAFPMGGQNWSFSTSQDYLAYLWPADGLADIYALNPDTGDVQQITSGMGVLEYTISRDGRMIYFSAGNTQGGSDLYQLDRAQVDPSIGKYDPVVILDCGLAQCRSPVESIDEAYLAYEYLPFTHEGGVNPMQIWLLSLTSLETARVSQVGYESVQPGWSQTGWLAYFDRSNSQYEVFNPQSQARRQFSNQTGQPGAWSPDGNFYLAPEIFYHQSAGEGETGSSHLLRYLLQTGASEDISQGDVEDVGGIYSPDGGTIAFARKFLDIDQWSLGRQIWVMNPDGSGAHPITDTADFNHYDLAWNQDSLKIAYVRFNQAKLSAPPELWMVNVDGSNPVELVIGGYSPLWIP